MNELVPLDQLATEIRYYSQQASWSIIEVGKRLIEAKKQVAHGEWENWLEKKVNYSQSTATRFMKCAERFGNLATLQDLNPSQTIALLSLPEAETEAFMEEKKAEGKPVEDMTVKALRQEIKDWKARAEGSEQKVAELEEKEAGYKDTIREQADKLANTGTNSEYLALKEAFDKQAQDLRSAREQADTYQDAWNRERENASKAYEMAQKNVEQSPKYQKLLKENETIKAHIQGKSLEQHAKETNQPELRRTKAEEKRIVAAIDDVVAALTRLPAKVEIQEWATVYMNEQEPLLPFACETIERNIPRLQLLMESLNNYQGIRRVK